MLGDTHHKLHQHIERERPAPQRKDIERTNAAIGYKKKIIGAKMIAYTSQHKLLTNQGQGKVPKVACWQTVKSSNNNNSEATSELRANKGTNNYN